MAESDLRALSSLLESVAVDLDPEVQLECRHFFGGAAGYADERIFMTLTSVGLALKLPEAARALLNQEGATPLRYFPKGPIKKDYVVVPERLAGDKAALSRWIRESIRYTKTLPKPKQRKSR